MPELLLLVLGAGWASSLETVPGRHPAAAVPPTFHREVLPILQNHCQSCHRPQGMAPMPFVTYPETRPWAQAIIETVESKKMPPWFADPRYGRFADDPSLTPQEIATIASWARSGAPAGVDKWRFFIRQPAAAR